MGGGAGGTDTCPPPKKNWEKYFSGNYYVTFGYFSGKNRAKFGNFVNFRAHIIKILFFDNFSGNNHVKFGHFVNFSYIFFSGKSYVVPP